MRKKPLLILVPALACALGLPALAFLAARPAVLSLELEEGESRMVPLSFGKGDVPADLIEPDAAVAEASLFLVDRERSVAHVLVTGVRRGCASWSLVLAGGAVLPCRVEVRPAPLRRSRGEDDRALAQFKIEEAARLESDIERDPANAWHAMVRCRDACEILLGIPYGGAGPFYRQAFARFNAAARRWASIYARVEGEFAIARNGGDANAARRALRVLLSLAPDERSAEYQRNVTLLRHLYGMDGKES